jgi:CHAT domain-containing protein
MAISGDPRVGRSVILFGALPPNRTQTKTLSHSDASELAQLPLPLNPGSSNSPTLGDGHPLLYLPSSSTLALIRQQSGRVASNRPASIATLADPMFSAKDPQLLVAPPDISSRPSQPTPTSGPTTDLKAVSFQRASASLENCDNKLSYCRLGFTRTEAKSIAALLPPNRVSLAVDFAADLQRATSADLGCYSLVQFATHGLFNGQQPALSGLLLSRVNRSGTAKDGFLQLGDIFNLKLNEDLVVLSACETALGDQVEGEGLVDITRGFLCAGTPWVVVSLWQVSDEATAAFMTSFYEAMLQKKLRAHPQWTSPYCRAAFALQGDW